MFANIHEAATFARRCYRVLLAQYGRPGAREITLRILYLHGFGPHGAGRRV